MRTFFRSLGHFCFFAGPIGVLIVAGLMISMNGVFGTVNPKTIDRVTLVRIMQLRDFRTLPPQTVAAIVDRADAEFGRKSPQKPVFQFSQTEKNVYAYFQNNRKNSQYHQSAKKAFFESNLVLMAKMRYFQWMSEYFAASPENRAVMMNEIADDMDYWGSVYRDFLRAAELPVPSLVELFQEFENMIENFKTGAAPEEIVRIDNFKKRLNGALVAREVQGAAKNLTGNVSTAVTSVFDSLLPSSKKQEKTQSSNIVSTSP